MAETANSERYLMEAEDQDGKKLTLYPHEASTKERKHTPVDCSLVKVADHICWKRPVLGYTHHAIVTTIDQTNERITLREWTKKKADGKIQIQESRKTFRDLGGQMYRVEYPDDVLRYNPPRLVLARARSRLGRSDNKYNPMGDNCEAFSEFCKVGKLLSQQVEAFVYEKLNQIQKVLHYQVRDAVKGFSVAVEMFSVLVGRKGAEKCLHNICKSTNFSSTSLVILCEGLILVWNLAMAYEKRKDGQLTRNEFLETLASSLTISIVKAGFVIVGGAGGGAIGATAGAAIGGAVGSVVPVVGTVLRDAGTAIGAVVGIIVGGVVDGKLRDALGTGLLSPPISKAISATIKFDDRPIKRLLDLNPADHVVFSAHALHPRCHAIVVKPISPTDVEIIRNTWEQGVVKEIIAYDLKKRPLYRVAYGSAETYSVEEILTRAESRLGDKSYSIATYNCKDFAYWCKLQTHFGTGRLAPSVGRVISATLKSGDVPVQSTLDLYTGDHIVFCAHALHPRCHAIVINTLSQTEIEVIRNTWERGVVREIVTHHPGRPLYMVNYKDEEMRRPRVVLERAFSRLGEKKYSIVSNNCKDFAYWCKWKKN